MKAFSWQGRPQWQLDLIHKYPDLYLTPNPDLSKQAAENGEYFCNLRHGFEFREGWKDLADKFSNITAQFVQKLRESGLQPDVYVRAFVFKEKFARLMWQGHCNLEEPFLTVFWGYVDNVAQLSTHICEVSGEPGEIRRIGWNLICLSNAEYEKRLGLRKPDE